MLHAMTYWTRASDLAAFAVVTLLPLPFDLQAIRPFKVGQKLAYCV